MRVMKAFYTVTSIILSMSTGLASTIYLPGDYQLYMSDIIVLDSVGPERTITYNLGVLAGDQIEFSIRYLNLNTLNEQFGDTAFSGEFAVYFNSQLLSGANGITSGEFAELSVPLPDSLPGDTVELRVSLEGNSDPLAFYRPWLRITDSIPPAPVSDLAVTAEYFSGLKLEWTSPGDDSVTGLASLYELRYSTDSLDTDTTSWWNAAIQVADPPAPGQPGTLDSLYVFDLDTSTTYNFILVAYDELGNRSGFSNLATGTTSRSYMNNCLRYDGIQFVEIPFNSALNPDTQITIEAWFYLDSSYTWNHATIIDKPAPSHEMPYYQYNLGPANHTDFYAQLAIDGRYNPFEQYNVLLPEIWTHVALVFDGSQRHLYINGALINSVNETGQLDSFSTAARIGALRNLNDWFYKGFIDELRIWSTARTQLQIVENMHRQLTGVEFGLAAYWNFNEGSGQLVSDMTSNHTDGYLGNSADPDENDPVWVRSTAPLDSLIDGISNGGLFRPDRSSLEQNYPNPFNSNTKIEFYLPETSVARIDIYDMLGRKVKLLADELFPSGLHNINWDGRSDIGETLSSGIYFCHLKTNGAEETVKLLMIK